ncbi:hypothetical protein ACVBEH_23705 [Roseateles sp. GG27B]
MYLVAIAWGYVAVLMALAEATSSQGSLLGALITFLLYGVLPISILFYLMGAPSRGKARRRAEAQAMAAAAARPSTQSDGGDHAAAEPLTPERKEP